MKTTPIYLAVVLFCRGPVLAQDKTESDSASKAKNPSTVAAAEKPKITAEELEAKFKATLTKATLTGRWSAVKDGALSPEKEDKYTIVGVTKLKGDDWVINARIQYNNKDMVAPIPVQVKWAGDTPVLIVDRIRMPSGGVYSARVLIYDHTYAGTWTGGDHGGLINGIITNEKH